MRKFTVLVCLSLLNSGLSASDWPTYRHDMARSGVTDEELRPPLAACWRFQPTHAPNCAWGEPNPRAVGGWFSQTEGRRVQFDDTFHVTASGDMLFFGSSADGCVYALDAATGAIRWSFITGGPVRLAPTIAGDRLYIGSDDGYAYCLNIKDGTEVWKYSAAPNDAQLLGSGQMISRWPLRTGILVDDGIAYFGAGVFPAEGVFVHAVDASTGYRLWCNDERGSPPQSRFSPQGYLLASKTALYVPTGRVSPAGLDRKSGRLLYETYFEHTIGGTYALLAGDYIFTGTNELMGYDKKTRARFAWFQARQIIISGDRCYLMDGRQMSAIDYATYPSVSLHREELRDRQNREQPAAAKAIKKAEEARRTRDQCSQTLTKEEANVKKEGAAPTEDLLKAKKAFEEAEKNLKSALADKAYTGWKNLQADIITADNTIAATKKWSCDTTCAESLIMAGSVLYAGGDGEVVAVDSTNGKKLWEVKVEGKARGLAVANGRLIVSTDTGTIHCFSTNGPPSPVLIQQPVEANPYPQDELTPLFEAAVTHILKTSPIRKGYALVLGSGTGRLAYELAKRTNLIIYGVEADAEKAAATRRKLQKAGLLGARIRIDPVKPGRLPYPDYFANLVVSETALIDGAMPASAAEAFRMTRPIDGMICIGQPAGAKDVSKPVSVATLRNWADDFKDLKGAVVSDTQEGAWLTFTRGPLPGAGSWTQEYANPANTTCGNDTHLTCPLGVLWYGKPGPAEMAERHTRASAPLAANGRMFIQGEGKGTVVGKGDNVIMSYDAYNGMKLWERSLKGALRTVMSHDGANAVVDGDSYFIVTSEGCLRLSAATGETTMTYKLPEDGSKSTHWGYLSVVENRLYGTRTESKRTGTDLFCLDVESGAHLWTFKADDIPQGAISIGDGKLFLAHASVTEQQRLDALAELTSAAEKLTGDARKAAEEAIAKADVRLIVALDAATGKTLWTRSMEMTGAISHDYWCSLGSIYKNGVLVMFGVYADGHFWKEFFAGKFESRRIFALNAADGAPLWKKNIGYRVRPIVVGDALHTEPWAYDLHTGNQIMRTHPITGRQEPWQFARPGHHCGAPAASENLLLFRSSTLGWYDLAGDFGTQHFGSLRTSCWINFIPANGVLMVPEGGSGCMCAFPTSCTVVFNNREDNRSWGCFSAPGAVTPVQHLAVNLGAPGDRRDPDGTLWLGYPRPGGSLVLQFSGKTAFYPGGGYFCHDPLELDIEGSAPPWICRSGMRGARSLSLPLIAAGEGAALYTVRLTFAEVENGNPGQRVFDIRIQDQKVASDVDVARDAGGCARTLIKEFKGIHVDDTLSIELTAKAAKPTEEQMPVLQGVEIVRERVLSLGVLLPAFELADSQPQKKSTIRLANHTEKEFTGTLRISAPDGFSITPAEQPVSIAKGATCELPITANVSKKGPRGKFKATTTLVRKDGTTEWEGQTAIEYLGPVARAVFKTVGDTWVIKKSPTTNYGKNAILNIDGGNAKAGDEDHAEAYLKFKPAVPGQPVRCILRIKNAGNPSTNSGEIRLISGDWDEAKVTYNNRPEPGRVLAKIGSVIENQELELELSLTPEEIQRAGDVLSLAIIPTSNDGVNYVSKEGGHFAELVIEYEPVKTRN